MATLCIQLRTGTMMNMDSNVAVKLARAAMDKGHQVKLFGYGEGITLIKNGQDPKRFPNVGKLTEGLIEDGAEVVVCSTCCAARGVQRGEEIKGATIGSITTDFTRFASEADRLVTIAR